MTPPRYHKEGLDFDRYLDAIQVASVIYLKTGPGVGLWDHAWRQLPAIGVQFGVDASPRIVHGQLPPNASFIMLQPSQHVEGVYIDGEQVADGEILVIPSGSHFTFVCQVPASWLAIVVSNAFAMSLIRSKRQSNAAGRKLLVKVAQEQIGRLSDLSHSALMSNDEAHHGKLQQDLLTDLRDVIIAGDHRWAPAVHTKSRAHIVVDKALSYVSAHQSETITVDDLVRVSGVEYRTLLRAFRRYLRISPKQYLKLRQLNLVRQILRKNGDSPGGVIAVMASLGVSEFGRFAADYKRLFGELPSQTRSIQS